MSAVAHHAHYDDSSRADELRSQFAADPAKIVEADEAWAGTLDGDQYGEMERALADLHNVNPVNHLLDSDVLARLYRLAKVCHAARDAALLDMAQDAADLEQREAEDMRADYADLSRDAA